MTDRISAYTVTLDTDIREDDAQEILTALRMVKGVASVAPIVADINQHIAYERVRLDVEVRLHSAVRDILRGEGAR